MKKGFTLIEVLVVVAIIGILSSLVLVGLGGARAKGRDARRISDLKNIQNGLELYFAKYGQYPSSLTDTNLAGSGGVVRTIPSDPNPNWGYGYCARSSDNGAYVLASHLEDADNPALREYRSDVFSSICTVSLPAGTPAGSCGYQGGPSSQTYCTTL